MWPINRCSMHANMDCMAQQVHVLDAPSTDSQDALKAQRLRHQRFSGYIYPGTKLRHTRFDSFLPLACMEVMRGY